jgi:hypothetical protein
VKVPDEGAPHAQISPSRRGAGGRGRRCPDGRDPRGSAGCLGSGEGGLQVVAPGGAGAEDDDPVNGKDRVSKGNVGLSYSYFGNSYQGIQFAAMADWDRTQPFTLIMNAGEKKGRAQIMVADAALKKRFPLDKAMLKRCASAVAPAGK